MGTFELIDDGRTVWVNTDICLGRFGRMGVDVHHDAAGQSQGKHCLDCFPRSSDAKADWSRFRASMERHHGIRLPNERPRP